MGEVEAIPELAERGKSRLIQFYKDLNDYLAGNQYAAGDEFSIGFDLIEYEHSSSPVSGAVADSLRADLAIS